MDRRYEILLEMADREFDGDSLNGPSLMATLDSLSASEALSTDTFEGYSAWEIAAHCAYYKYLIARGLGAGAELEPYPFAEGNFPPPPAGAGDSAWKEARDYLRLAHRVCSDEIRASGPAALDGEFAQWKMAFRDAIAWLCSHDSYHNAQIRSMGLPALRKAKGT